jgi:hypothetical protein
VQNVAPVRGDGEDLKDLSYDRAMATNFEGSP